MQRLPRGPHCRFEVSHVECRTLSFAATWKSLGFETATWDFGCSAERYAPVSRMATERARPNTASHPHPRIRGHPTPPKSLPVTPIPKPASLRAPRNHCHSPPSQSPGPTNSPKITASHPAPETSLTSGSQKSLPVTPSQNPGPQNHCHSPIPRPATPKRSLPVAHIPKVLGQPIPLKATSRSPHREVGGRPSPQNHCQSPIPRARAVHAQR